MIEKCSDTNIKPVRVFFAIFPNKFVQDQLTHQTGILESTCGGRKVKSQHMHLTLLFLGNVSAHRIETLQQAVKNILAEKFELSLEEIRCWKQSQIVYIQAKRFPAELFSLVNSLKSVLSEAGFSFDKRAYKPHITLIRKATHQARIDLTKPIKWHVNQWFLVQSKQTDYGIDYIPLSQWCLK